MNDTLEPFDPDLQALLDQVKTVPPLPAAELERLHGKVAARLALPVGGGGQGGSGSAPLSRALTASKAVAVASLLSAGVVAGIVLDRTVLRAPAVAPVPAPLLSVAALAPTVHDDAPWIAVPQASAPAETPPAPALRVAPSHADVSARGLDAERALLDVARSSLAHGEPAAALAATRRHASEYPRGALVEEREALTIKALVAAGRREEARTRAADFEQRFPNGLMLRAVRAAVGTTH